MGYPEHDTNRKLIFSNDKDSTETVIPVSFYTGSVNEMSGLPVGAILFDTNTQKIYFQYDEEQLVLMSEVLSDTQAFELSEGSRNAIIEALVEQFKEIKVNNAIHADAATKTDKSLTIKINSNAMPIFDFNGSADKILNVVDGTEKGTFEINDQTIKIGKADDILLNPNSDAHDKTLFLSACGDWLAPYVFEEVSFEDEPGGESAFKVLYPASGDDEQKIHIYGLSEMPEDGSDSLGLTLSAAAIKSWLKNSEHEFNNTVVFNKYPDPIDITATNKKVAPVIIGTPEGSRIEIDNNEIMAKSSTDKSNLSINREGGNIYIGMCPDGADEPVITNGVDYIYLNQSYNASSMANRTFVGNNRITYLGDNESPAASYIMMSADTEGGIKSSGISLNDITTLQSKVEGLSNAMHFIGITTTSLSDGASTKPIQINGKNINPSAGDVVIGPQTTEGKGGEYVWDGSKWELLGDESSYVLRSEIANNTSDTDNNHITTINYLKNYVTNAIASIEDNDTKPFGYSDDSDDKKVFTHMRISTSDYGYGKGTASNPTMNGMGEGATGQLYFLVVG